MSGMRVERDWLHLTLVNQGERQLSILRIEASSPLNHEEQSAFLAFSFTLLTCIVLLFFLLTTLGIKLLYLSVKLLFTTFNFSSFAEF